MTGTRRGTSVRRPRWPKLKTPLAILVSLLALGVAVPVMAHGPQPLPSASCKEGTMTAHEASVQAPRATVESRTVTTAE